MSGPYRTHLQVVDVASPCAEDWSKMHGDDSVRFCLKCSNNVYDLSELTRPEIERLLALHEGGGVCVRMHRRRDGTLVTADCAPARRAFFVRALSRHVVVATVTTVCVSAATALLAMFVDGVTAAHATPTYLGPPPVPPAQSVEPNDEEVEVFMGLMAPPTRRESPTWVEVETLSPRDEALRWPPRLDLGDE